jgi:hydrogenase maturation protease
MTPRVLVAGVGNVFLGDDGFGVALARRLAEQELPDRVVVGDYGISGMHLAYDLLETYARLVLLDATARGEEPGTVTVLDVDPADPDFGPTAAQETPPDAHGMQPDAVLGLLDQLGGRLERMLVVGCEPVSVADEMALSPAIEAAVERAMPLVIDLARRVRDEEPQATPVPPTTRKEG